MPVIMEKFEGLNAICLVGGTGAGKSTMINSLLYGSGVLEKKGKKIALKEEMRIKLGNSIHIGLDQTRSQTTFPEVAEDFLQTKEGLVFIDLAGILDNRGHEFDLVFAMMLGYLMKNLNTARFVHALSKSEIEVVRGGIFKGGLFMIDGMC